MTKYTPHHGLPYPEGDDSVAVHSDIRLLAVKTDAEVELIRAGLIDGIADREQLVEMTGLVENAIGQVSADAYDVRNLASQVREISGLTGEDEAVAFLMEGPSATQVVLDKKTAGRAGQVDARAAALQLGQVVDMPVTPYGHYDYVHPSVIHAAGGWRGYEYWMAVTPLPSNGDNQQENPCIYASHDGFTWEEPEGLVNPITGAPQDAVNAYHADTELVLYDDTLYCFYTTNWTSNDVGDPVYKVSYKTSTNGITWSEEKLCYSYNRYERRFQTPCVIPLDGVWHVFAVDEVTKKIIHMHGPSASGPWTEPVYGDLVDPLPDGREVWHITVSWTGHEWHMLLNDSDIGASGRAGGLFFYRSLDGTNWTGGKKIIPQVGTDYRQFYRSAWVPVKSEGTLVYDVWANVFSQVTNIRRFMRRGRLTFGPRSVFERFDDEFRAAKTGQPPYIAWDNFDRPNGPLGSTPTGLVWQGITPNAGLEIHQRTVRPTSSNSLYAVQTNEKDVYVEIKLRALETVAEGQVIARASTNNTYLAWGWNRGSLQFRGVNNGSNFVTQLRANRPTVFGLEGEPIILAMRVEGDRVTCYVNGQQAGDVYIIPSAYTQLLENTHHGFGNGSNASEANRTGDFLVRRLF